MSGAWQRPVTVYQGEDEAQLRERFARIRAQFPTLNDFEVASECFKGLPDAPARAGAAALAWGRDADILSRVQELRRVGFVDDVEADQATVKQEILAFARNDQVDDKVRLDAYKLYADVAGMIQKGGTNVNVAIVNRVMKVTDHGSDEAWEARVEAQQRGLMNVTPAH